MRGAPRTKTASLALKQCLTITVGLLAALVPLRGQQGSGDDPFRFRSSVELVNVTATVSDSRGRFVSGLNAEDFTVYEDDVRQTVSQFSAERVPVSLGIALDTSGSMAGEKIEAARAALDRFLYTLLGRGDEVFLYRFSDRPFLLQGWTTDHDLIGRALGQVTPHGGTAMYDTVLEAVPLARKGGHQKKALLLISDGNDTSSAAAIGEVKERIRQSEVLVYAIGIDGDDVPMPRAPVRRPQPRRPPLFPGGPRRPPWVLPQAAPQILGPRSSWPGQINDQRVNVPALRNMTDDSGGRTEIVRRPMDLGPATAGIADELSKQYYLGYISTNGQKDGRWRSIRVEMRSGVFRVRARRGYVAN